MGFNVSELVVGNSLLAHHYVLRFQVAVQVAGIVHLLQRQNKLNCDLLGRFHTEEWVFVHFVEQRVAEFGHDHYKEALDFLWLVADHLPWIIAYLVINDLNRITAFGYTVLHKHLVFVEALVLAQVLNLGYIDGL